MKCHQCAGIFHTHPYNLARIPIGGNVLILCPDNFCRAENAYARVPMPDFLINANEFQSQREAIWYPGTGSNGSG